MWLAVHKNATHMPTTLATAYLAYADEESAPTGWEIIEITCAQGPELPDGAAGFPEPPVARSAADQGTSLSRCYWLRAHNSSGSLEAMMSFELTASGLAEDRDDQVARTLILALPLPLIVARARARARARAHPVPVLNPNPNLSPIPNPNPDLHPNPTPNPDPDPNQAYAAALTYDLVYEREIPKRREQFTVPIYTRVTAVPVAARSVRGRLPSGARCDNASLAANSSGAVLVELGREASQWRK